MGTFIVEALGIVTPAATVEQHMDSVMEAMLGLDTVDDPLICADRDGCRVNITAVIQCTTIDDAHSTGPAIIRNAIHAAGGSTVDDCSRLGWRVEFSEYRTTVAA